MLSRNHWISSSSSLKKPGRQTIVDIVGLAHGLVEVFKFLDHDDGQEHLLSSTGGDLPAALSAMVGQDIVALVVQCLAAKDDALFGRSMSTKRL